MRSEYDYSAKGGKRAQNAPFESLTRRKEQAIAALLSRSTLTEAAASCGISDRTLRRWMRNKSFFRRYRRERALLLDGVVDVLKASAVGAVETLVTIMHGKRMPASSRVAAASRVLEFNFKTHELMTLEKRITQLEELAKERP